MPAPDIVGQANPTAYSSGALMPILGERVAKRIEMPAQPSTNGTTTEIVSNRYTQRLKEGKMF